MGQTTPCLVEEVLQPLLAVNGVAHIQFSYNILVKFTHCIWILFHVLHAIWDGMTDRNSTKYIFLIDKYTKSDVYDAHGY